MAHGSHCLLETLHAPYLLEIISHVDGGFSFGKGEAAGVCANVGRAEVLGFCAGWAWAPLLSWMRRSGSICRITLSGRLFRLGRQRRLAARVASDMGGVSAVWLTGGGFGARFMRCRAGVGRMGGWTGSESAAPQASKFVDGPWVGSPMPGSWLNPASVPADSSCMVAAEVRVIVSSSAW